MDPLGGFFVGMNDNNPPPGYRGHDKLITASDSLWG